MNRVIDEDYETYKQKTKWASYCKLVERCEEQGVLTPSYRTFREEIKKRDRNHTKNNKVSAKKLANFLASAEAQESLFQQRNRDFETQQVFN